MDGGEDPVDGARVLGDALVDVGALGERVVRGRAHSHATAKGGYIL